MAVGSLSKEKGRLATAFYSCPMSCIACFYGAGSSIVLLLLYDCVASQSDLGLCEQPAVPRRARVERDLCLRQHHTLHVRGRSNAHDTGHLPHDVLGKCATRQDNPRRGGLRHAARDLEDPGVGAAAFKSNSCGEENLVPPLVRPRRKRQPADIAAS